MASFDDVNIFDVGSIEPRELTPSEKRLELVAQSLQKMGYTPRRSYQMANKITGLGETVGEFLPGASTKLAEERGDKLGIALSHLDYLGPAGTAAAIPVKVARKGIASLSDEAKDLMFLHNTGDEAIANYAKMGGIPSPSIAVTKKDMPFDKFGEIQLIGKPKNFDPMVNDANKIYSSDAYTPRMPEPFKLAKSDAEDLFIKDYQNLGKEFGADYTFYAGQLNKLSRSSSAHANQMTDLDNFFHGRRPLAKVKYLREKGITVNPVMKKGKKTTIEIRELARGPTHVVVDAQTGKGIIGFPQHQLKEAKKYQQELLDAKGLDPWQSERHIEKLMAKHGDGYNDWVLKQKSKYLTDKTYFKTQDEVVNARMDKLSDIINSPQGRTNMDLYEKSVLELEALDRKQFKTLPYTLDNVVNNMKTTMQRGGEEGVFAGGLGKLKALMAESYPDLKTVKAKKRNIQDIENSSVRLPIQQKHAEISEDINKIADLSWDRFDDVLETIVRQGGTKEVIEKNTAIMLGKSNPKIANKIADLLDDIKNAEVPYFEAKPMRAVGLDEFAGAIVPTNTPKSTIDILKSKGLKVVVSDNRIKARDKFKKEMFSLVPIGVGAGVIGSTLDEPLEGNTREIL